MAKKWHGAVSSIAREINSNGENKHRCAKRQREKSATAEIWHHEKRHQPRISSGGVASMVKLSLNINRTQRQTSRHMAYNQARGEIIISHINESYKAAKHGAKTGSSIAAKYHRNVWPRQRMASGISISSINWKATSTAKHQLIT